MNAILLKMYIGLRLEQCFSTAVRQRPGKFFFHKTRSRSQHIYSSVPFLFLLSSYIKLTCVLIINYGIIIKSISTIMCTVWHVDKYKITFKLVINSRRISRGPVIIDARARRLRNTDLEYPLFSSHFN